MNTAIDKKIPFLKKVTEWDEAGNAGEVKFVLGNGQQVIVTESEISPENRYRLMIHGISQKLGDTCAAYSKDSNFADAYKELVELKELLATQDWSRMRE